MKKIITYENLRNFAYSNDSCIKNKIRGIIISFAGLGGVPNLKNTDSGKALEFAELGIIYVVPYYNPWCWMNRQAVKYTDEIIDVLCDKYSLNPDTVKIVSSGSSMGGLAALVYCVYAKIQPCACVANCPVCDLPYHYTERVDLPRTLYSAFGEYDCTMEEALKSASPIHLVEKLPDIPYNIFHCEKDEAVNLEKHSRRLYEKMQNTHQISLKTVPLRNHGDLSPEALVEYKKIIVSYFY